MKTIWRANPNGPLFWPSDAALKAEKDLGITRIYYPLLKLDPTTNKYVPNDIEINMSYRQDIDDHFGYAVYYDVSWDSETHADKVVEKMLAARDKTNAESVMWDIEYHRCDDLVMDIIKLWRTNFGPGPISWTLEPFQAGWFSTSLVNKINNDPNFVVVVQNFLFDMSPAGVRGGLTPRQELVKRGIKDNRVKTFYDGKLLLPAGWDGCILSEERLPSYH